MTKRLSAGKYRHLTTLADARGIFKMVAVDQRPPLLAALARHGEREPAAVSHEELRSVKVLLTKALAPSSSAVLIDPVWAHPSAFTQVPGSVGLISTLEDHRFEVREGERYSKLIEGWSVAKIKRAGAAGVKLLVWHRPDTSAANQAHQDELVRAVGEECRRHDIPLILELLIYPLPDEVADSPEYAAGKPRLVVDSVTHFSDDGFGVDLLKLEFPADLKFTREFSAGAFDGRGREAVYDLAAVQQHLSELDAVTNVPWVLLTAGVGPREFAVDLELALSAGASGFLAGRAVWMDTLAHYPDLAAMERQLLSSSVPYLASLSGLADAGRPWPQHRRFGGAPALDGAADNWHANYQAGP